MNIQLRSNPCTLCRREEALEVTHLGLGTELSCSSSYLLSHRPPRARVPSSQKPKCYSFPGTQNRHSDYSSPGKSVPIKHLAHRSLAHVKQMQRSPQQWQTCRLRSERHLPCSMPPSIRSPLSLPHDDSSAMCAIVFSYPYPDQDDNPRSLIYKLSVSRCSQPLLIIAI